MYQYSPLKDAEDTLHMFERLGDYYIEHGKSHGFDVEGKVAWAQAFIDAYNAGESDNLPALVDYCSTLQ